MFIFIDGFNMIVYDRFLLIIVDIIKFNVFK